MSTTWQDEVHRELKAAHEAANNNLNGRSRVAARRAAGRAVKEYLYQIGLYEDTHNFYELLQDFASRPGLPADISESARLLCQQVNEDFSLPDEINLLTEADHLIEYIKSQIDIFKADGQR